jgi:thiamine pyrophosphokinase
MGEVFLQKINQLSLIKPNGESLTKSIFYLIGPMDMDLEITDQINNHQESSYYIFIDGGIRHRHLFPALTPDQFCTIGDGDSSLIQNFGFFLDSKKDFSDFHAALNLVPTSAKDIHLLGFLGGRLDHQLAILGPLYRMLKNREIQWKNICFEFSKARFFSAGTHEFNCDGVFSLLAIEDTEIILTGNCEYPVTHNTILKPLSDLGISNVGHGMVKLQCNSPLLIIF